MATSVYQLSLRFPSEEKFGLTSQIRRASVSISSNIAEGSGRSTDKDFANFLAYSYGSLCEVDTQLQIAVNLKFVEKEAIEDLVIEIEELQRMIYSFKRSLRV